MQPEPTADIVNPQPALILLLIHLKHSPTIPVS